MPPDSEIVCPFCQARHPLLARTFQPLPTEISGNFNFYQCPCGALGLTAHTIDGPGWDVHRTKDAISQILLGAQPADCRVDMNRVTFIDPPMWILWVKRRAWATPEPQPED